MSLISREFVSFLFFFLDFCFVRLLNRPACRVLLAEKIYLYIQIDIQCMAYLVVCGVLWFGLVRLGKC